MHTRKAEKKDIADIASIHVQCWNEVYPYIPNEVHENRDVSFRQNQWSNILESNDHGSQLFVLTTGPDGKVVGFCYCKSNEDEDIASKGEMHAMYALPEYRGGTCGHLMLAAMVQHLIDTELTPISLWVFKENKIKYWYKSLGFEFVKSRDRVISGHKIPELGYICTNTSELIDRLNKPIHDLSSAEEDIKNSSS